MMRLEFLMILISEGAVGVYSVAMLTLQGACSQLKYVLIKQPTLAMQDHPPQPLLLQLRGDQIHSLLLPPRRKRWGRGVL